MHCHIISDLFWDCLNGTLCCDSCISVPLYSSFLVYTAKTQHLSVSFLFIPSFSLPDAFVLSPPPLFWAFVLTWLDYSLFFLLVIFNYDVRLHVPREGIQLVPLILNCLSSCSQIRHLREVNWPVVVRSIWSMLTNLLTELLILIVEFADFHLYGLSANVNQLWLIHKQVGGLSPAQA